MTLPRALVLVDGEHYPPVTRAALQEMARDVNIVGAVMIGGGEKLSGELDVGVPLIYGHSQRGALERAIDEYGPDIVIDCSDAPVVDTRARMLLASVAIARGVPYAGAGFRFDPPPRPRLSDVPTIAVIGTGKRTGKTAVSAALARHAIARGKHTVVVAMGRGGPAEPVVTYGARARPTHRDLIALADGGEHAASDTYEDAVVAGVTTVGARRAGAGITGAPLYDTVARAVGKAVDEAPDLIILEGSGTAIPPARAGATVLIVGGSTPSEELGGLGFSRLLISDVVIVTMAEEPVLSSDTLATLTSSLTELGRDVPLVRTVFRPTPVGSVMGKNVFFATTAPASVGRGLVKHLEEVHGATVVGVTHHLSERTRLSEDLAHAEGTYEVLLTELKAAAIDVAARAALAVNADVVFCDNEPQAVDGDLATVFDMVIERAEQNR